MHLKLFFRLLTLASFQQRNGHDKLTCRLSDPCVVYVSITTDNESRGFQSVNRISLTILGDQNFKLIKKNAAKCHTANQNM